LRMKQDSSITPWFYALWDFVLTLGRATRYWLGRRRSKTGERDTIRALEERLQLMELRTQQLQQANRELLRMSRLDSMTGIANRRHFEEVLDAEWGRACRAGTALALIMIDIDFFKAFNDAYGHQCGDERLKLLAGVLRDTLHRPGDLAARYGGEEFMVLLPGTSADGALEVAETLRARVEARQTWVAGSAIDKPVTISLGVVTRYPTRAFSPAAMIAAVDKALYLAKQQGRNRVVKSEPAVGGEPAAAQLSSSPAAHEERAFKRRAGGD